jgi:diguanylate cyclase (GGDEF)-like protein
MLTVQTQTDLARILHVARFSTKAFGMLVIAGVTNWYIFHANSDLPGIWNVAILAVFLLLAGARPLALRRIRSAVPQGQLHLATVSEQTQRQAKWQFSVASLGLGLTWATWMFFVERLPLDARATVLCIYIASMFIAVGSLAAFARWHAMVALPPLLVGIVVLFMERSPYASVWTTLLGAMYATLVFTLLSHQKALLASIQDNIRAQAIDLQQQRMFESGRNAIVVANRKELVRTTALANTLLGLNELAVLLDLRVGLGAKQSTWDRLWNRVESHLERTGLLSATVRFKRPDGQDIWVELQARFVDPVAPARGILWQLADATERRELEERNLYLATHDPLTGCWNRTAIESSLRELASQPVGERSTAGFSLLSLDLDGFKLINDKHGHAVGDAVLKIVKQRLENILRPSDMVGRLGGDEFIVLLPQTPLREQSALVSEKIVDAISQAINVDQQVVSVGVSVGLAVWPTDSLDPEALLRIADVNMYTSKQAGRNAYRRALTGFI